MTARRLLALTAVLVLGGMVLMTGCDDLFPPDDFQPTGTPFQLDPGIVVGSVMGGDRPVANGFYTLDLTCRADGGASDVLPAGLFLVSTSNRVEHMVLLQPFELQPGPEMATVRVGTFGCNRFRESPDGLDTFDLGPVTTNGGLRDVIDLVEDRDVSADVALVQRAVYMVTDSTGLTQAYRDSLADLPEARR